MRLNFDCVRAIMLWAEELTTPTQPAVYVNIDSLSKTRDLYLDDAELPVPDDHQQALLSNYSNEVLVYHWHTAHERTCLSMKSASMQT